MSKPWTGVAVRWIALTLLAVTLAATLVGYVGQRKKLFLTAGMGHGYLSLTSIASGLGTSVV